MDDTVRMSEAVLLENSLVLRHVGKRGIEYNEGMGKYKDEKYRDERRDRLLHPPEIEDRQENHSSDREAELVGEKVMREEGKKGVRPAGDR